MRLPRTTRRTLATLCTVAAALTAGIGAPLAADIPATGVYDIRGGKVDLGTYRGWLTYHIACHSCHGRDALTIGRPGEWARHSINSDRRLPRAAIDIPEAKGRAIVHADGETLPTRRPDERAHPALGTLKDARQSHPHRAGRAGRVVEVVRDKRAGAGCSCLERRCSHLHRRARPNQWRNRRSGRRASAARQHKHNRNERGVFPHSSQYSDDVTGSRRHRLFGRLRVLLQYTLRSSPKLIETLSTRPHTRAPAL